MEAQLITKSKKIQVLAGNNRKAPIINLNNLPNGEVQFKVRQVANNNHLLGEAREACLPVDSQQHLGKLHQLLQM